MFQKVNFTPKVTAATKIVRECHMSLNVCISHTLGITSATGGRIGSVISNIVNKTKDEINYTLLTTYKHRDDVEARVDGESSNASQFLGCSISKARVVSIEKLRHLCSSFET